MAALWGWVWLWGNSALLSSFQRNLKSGPVLQVVLYHYCFILIPNGAPMGSAWDKFPVMLVAAAIVVRGTPVYEINPT